MQINRIRIDNERRRLALAVSFRSTQYRQRNALYRRPRARLPEAFIRRLADAPRAEARVSRGSGAAPTPAGLSMATDLSLI